MYTRILVERVRRVTKGLIGDNEQVGFRSERECMDQIFTLNKIVEKVREKKRRVYVEKVYDRVNVHGKL